MRFRWLASMLVLCLGLGLLSTWSLGVSASTDLPPRPQPCATRTPLPPSAPAGATLALHATFPEARDVQTVNWRTLWTAVQWQDAAGDWHTVTGWQGNFDYLLPQDNRFFGLKTWWVAPQDMRTGPFRWVVYEQRDGEILATSESFYLPASPRSQKIIEAVLMIP